MTLRRRIALCLLLSLVVFLTPLSSPIADTTLSDLAQMAVDDGLNQLKDSPNRWASVQLGGKISGYDFDRVYQTATGSYRVRILKGDRADEVIIQAEARSQGLPTLFKSSRYKRKTLLGPLMSSNDVILGGGFAPQWGPVISLNNITFTSASTAQEYFPRKIAKGVVSSNIPAYPRDTNGLAQPNTDGAEWTSGARVILPQLDFDTLRAQAAQSGTLNVYGCSKMRDVASPWWGKNICPLPGRDHTGLKHFQNTWNHPLAHNERHTWYWDNDVILTGDVGDEGNGIWGDVIVRGNLTNAAGDNYFYTGPIPAEGWREYKKITTNTGDTAVKNEYPGDDGYQKNRATFEFGNETWTGAHPMTPALSDVGFRGLVYVGGNFDAQAGADVNGTVWVEGQAVHSVGSEPVTIFFDDTLTVPVKNVPLVFVGTREVLLNPLAIPQPSPTPR